MSAIREHESVRVLMPPPPERHLETVGHGAPPGVGDEGVVVSVHERGGEVAGYTVECVAPDGRTVWLAQFLPDEVEPW